MQMKMFPSQEMTLIGASNISQPYLSTKGINNFAVSHLNKDMEKLKITLLVIVIRINPGLTSLFGIHVRKLQLWTDGRDKNILENCSSVMERV